MTASPSTPLLAGSEHDTNGRLVAMTFDSAPPQPGTNADPWLIAVDSSDNALRAVALAAQQAAVTQTGPLHLIHVQPWLSLEAAETELAHRALEATARARGLLDAKGLPWRLHVAMGEPAERILAAAGRLHAAGIVIGSRGLNTVERLLFGSVAYKVLHSSQVPVLVVP